MTALVEAHDLAVHFTGRRRRVVAVDGVSLSVPRRTTVGLVGESGSGKSTIGNALLGLVPATSGRIVFDGQDITHVGAARRRALTRRMQVVFQDPFGSMNPVRTIADTLTEGLRHNLGLPREQIDERVEQALADVNLPTTVLQRYPGQFSGGQRQRIAIARALVLDPDFLVCDEAVSALDLSVQAQVLNVLAELGRRRGLAHLFISHDLAVVRYLAHEIVVLYRGRVVERGPARQVSEHPAHPYTQALVAAEPVPDPREQARRRAARLAATRASSTPAGGRASAPAAGCGFAARCPLATERCRTEDPQLRPLTAAREVACHHAEQTQPVLEGPS